MLCAGLIGFRALRMLLDALVVGLYGFGAAAHLIAQVALRKGRRVVWVPPVSNVRASTSGRHFRWT